MLLFYYCHRVKNRQCNTENEMDQVFKNGPSKICRRQPFKNFIWPILEYFFPNINNIALSLANQNVDVLRASDNSSY